MRLYVKLSLLSFLTVSNFAFSSVNELDVNSKNYSSQSPQTTFYRPTGEAILYNTLGDTAIIEGDIAVGYKSDVQANGIKNLEVRQFEEVHSNADHQFTAKAAWSGNTTWANSVVPYVISSASQADIAAIQNGMLLISTRTGVKFVPRTNQADYIEVIKGSGCWSHVGRRGGRQELSIGNGCAYAGIVAHEFLHALGFFHEQSRYDRDNYVRINWENISAGTEHNFNKGASVTASIGSYDFRSIMQYGYMSFSANGLPTIESLDPSVPSSELGQRGKLTDKDVAAVAQIYGAGGNANGGPQGYIKCADENEVCNFNGKASVAFGAIGKYNYIEAENQVSCSNRVFGDPVEGAAKSCYYKLEVPTGVTLQGFTQCAGEGEECITNGGATVAYGANGAYYFLKTQDRIPCNNRTFGDPLSGIVKACYFKRDDNAAPAGFTFCAREGEKCAFVGSAEVAFGANDAFYSQQATSAVECSNTVFGDPAYGIAKSCFYKTVNAIPAGFHECAAEGQTCTFSGTATIAYGANGVFTYREANGNIACTNASFGDPYNGVRKYCYIKQ